MAVMMIVYRDSGWKLVFSVNWLVEVDLNFRNFDEKHRAALFEGYITRQKKRCLEKRELGDYLKPNRKLSASC